MLAVALSAKEILAYFDMVEPDCGDSSTLVVSCINSHRNTTVSGEEYAIEGLKQILDGEGIFARRLRVPVAYHSPQMDLIVSDCLRAFTSLEFPRQESNIKMVSSVTGSVLTKEQACEASYWTDNMVSPVLFSQAMERILHDSHRSLRSKIDGSHRNAIVVDTLVEVGPHAALQLPIQEILETLPPGKDIRYFSVLYRKQSASISLLRLIGELYCCGAAVDLRRVNDPEEALQGLRVSLVDAPEYPFDHSKKYWSESPLVKNYRLRAHGHVELLGSPSRDWNPLQPQWRCHVQISDMPWLMDHKLNGRAVYPASAMIVMVMQGVSQLLENDKATGFTLRNVVYGSPIVVMPDSTDLETRLQLKPVKVTQVTYTGKLQRWDFCVHSVNAGHWIENCSGTVEIHLESISVLKGIQERSRFYERCFKTRSSNFNMGFDSKAVYEIFSKSGFHYGPSFQGITSLCHSGSNTVTAALGLGNTLSGSSSKDWGIIHPARLDSFFHLALISLSGGNNPIPTQAISRINRLWIAADGLSLLHTPLHASARLEDETPRTKTYSGFALTEDNMDVKLVLDGLQTTIVASVDETDLSARHGQLWCHVQTAVDVEILPGAEILRRLNSTCGPDSIGPSNFFLDLRRYLYFVVKQLRCSVEVSGPDSTKPYLKKYMDWMDWHLSKPIEDSVGTEGDHIVIRQRIAAHGFLGEFFLKVADNALDVLQGKSDMVQLIFENNLVESFYEEFLLHSSYYEKLQKYLEDLSFKHPSMDFLEIGAGTGSFTERILKAVSSSAVGAKERLNSYYYTDVSPAFFERARERFSSHAERMKFGLLNANQDPLGQGFKGDTFDVIAASNVLHVTNNLDHTLHGLRKLLRPGGKLLLHEYTHPERIEVGFVFGLLPGWWPDDESRKLGPLASEETWDVILRRNGFSGADFILRDFADKESHLMSIICATAVEPQEVVAVLPDVVIAVEPGSSSQADTAEALLSRLCAEGCRAVQMDIFSQWGEVASDAVMVTLFDLESAILSRLDETRFDSLKSLLSITSKQLWVSKGKGPSLDPAHGMVDGFARVFRIENINSKLATLALDIKSSSTAEDCSLVISALQQLLKHKGLDQPEDYVVRDGALCVNRIYESTTFKAAMSEKLSGHKRTMRKAKEAEPFRVTFKDFENSQSPRITECSAASDSLGSDEIEIHVRAVCLNSVDFSTLQGRSSTIKIGRECAGIVTRVGNNCDGLTVGDHVCAYGADMLRSTSRAKRSLVAKVPKCLSFEEASTMPQDCIMANYLVQEARIQRGDVVIVIGGDKRLGRATLGELRNYAVKLCTTVCTTESMEVEGIEVFTESCFTESFRSSFSTGANVVLDFANTDVLQLAEYVSAFGNILSVRTADNSSYSSHYSGLPCTVGFKVVDVAEVLLHQAERLEISSSALSQKSLTQPFPFKTVNLSSMKGLISCARMLEPEERIAITFDDESQIEVCMSLILHFFTAR